MAETPSKRHREETLALEDCEDSKRQKSYTHILSILEDEEDEPNQDLSAIFTSLQQELSCNSNNFDPSLSVTAEADPDHQTTVPATSECSPSSHGEEDDKERVIRHLLEASDDELGIPHKVDGGDDDINGRDLAFALCDGFWEFEDETANYYALLQSELFM
ncbi:unnamed protein product [Ilex paraguariensis]|uniref:Uncharacterized protein n=1 Tax=Ilex paraguariensis TaxID=185542 RepID=A0ABC8URS4_9AQUA